MANNQNFTIVLFPKVQVDTAIAFFLLKTFGEAKFPGISEAPLEFWSELPGGKNGFELEDEGYILVDLGNGRFDHHRLGPENKTTSASHLVAEFLGVDDKQELVKLLELARRDDLEGKGTISKDSIDRAFGISGLLMSLMKTYPDDPHMVLNSVLPLLHAHYVQEYRRYEELPKEYASALAEGRAKVFNAMQLGKKLMVVYIETDNTAIPSFLRSKDVGAHLVIQKSSAGHVNIISKQAENLELHILSKNLKLLEAQKNNLTLLVDHISHLERPGRTDGLPHWYYDTRANTIQNGGINAQGIPPSKLTYEELETMVKQSLNIEKDQSRKVREQEYIRRGELREREGERNFGNRGFRNSRPGDTRQDRFSGGNRGNNRGYGNKPSYGGSRANRQDRLAPGERRIRGAIVID